MDYAYFQTGDIMKNLLNEDYIQQLINFKREGDFWDFKEKWYENNVDLVGDIINFANTTHHKDCYIIIGIKDADFEIVGVQANDTNRKNTQNIQDMLHNISFEGGRIPIVRVMEFQIQGKLIDVITIFDSNQVPFYLTKEYHIGRKKIPAGVIYSRIEDTNTEKVKSASLNQMENLWKKRFKLDITPAKRLVDALSYPETWKKQYDFEHEMEYYYWDDAPEFQIRILPDDDTNRESIMPYSINQDDISIGWYTIDLVIGNTKIFDMQCISLDGGRYVTVSPEPKFINYEHKPIKYYVMLKDTVIYSVYEFLKNKQQESEDSKYSDSKYMEEFIILNNETDERQLQAYLQQQISTKKFFPTEDEINNVVQRLRWNTDTRKNIQYDEWAKQILLANNIAKFSKEQCSH